MKRLGLFFSAVLAVAAVSAFCAIHVTRQTTHVSDIAAHQWLHRELRLTPAQEKALVPIEERFTHQQRELAKRLLEANQELGRVIAQEKEYNGAVDAAVEAVHRRMGDLQKASIEHVFEMRSVLSPEQGERLLELTQSSLERHKTPAH
jgi:nickel and cobalt resistance protein CnrR